MQTDAAKNALRALSELVEQIDSLDDVKFTRDLEPHEAEACWEGALYQARSVLNAAKEAA